MPARVTHPALIVTMLALLAGCGGANPSSASDSSGHGRQGTLRVVAAENFWGNIATQLAGARASAQSVIADPNRDPHSYEPTAADARTMATAQLAIVNGIGYDNWAPKLLAADPASDRVVLTVGNLLGLKEGDNPHRWYSPANVETVADTITADLEKLDPKDALYFEARLRAFDVTALARYHALIAQIKSRYAGVAVGASESIFALQAPALGLNVVTPPNFLKAISEGTDPTAQDKATIDSQIAHRQIKVWIYNAQNATPDVKRVNQAAQARHIPITTITETLTPPGASFQQWQVGQLQTLRAALHAATSR